MATLYTDTRLLHSTTLQSSVIERTRPFQAVCCCCAQEQESTLSFVLIYWKTAVECYKTSTKSWRIEYYNLYFSSNWCDKKVVVSMFWSILPNLVRLSYCHNGFLVEFFSSNCFFLVCYGVRLGKLLSVRIFLECIKVIIRKKQIQVASVLTFRCLGN